MFIYNFDAYGFMHAMQCTTTRSTHDYVTEPQTVVDPFPHLHANIESSPIWDIFGIFNEVRSKPNQ